MSEYLRLHGADLVDAGYQIVPIPPGKKSPNYDGWQNTRSSRSMVDNWINAGRDRHGIGILTKHTPAIDIDIMDEDVADLVESWCVETFGAAPVRIGQAPKRLLLFKVKEPFRKLRSAIWFDEWNEKQQIEILGDGQQFVAYHTHPETRTPYRWVRNGDPLTVPADDLIELDVDQARELLIRFDKHAESLGWRKAHGARRPTLPGQMADMDDPFIEDSQPIDLSFEEIRERLLMIPEDDAADHDTWFQVGMALYHQFDGSEEGLELWHEWSEQAHNYDATALDTRWASFSINGKGRAPITARYILKLASEAADLHAQKAMTELKDAFRDAKDEKEFRAACAKARRAEIDYIAREGLLSLVQDSHQRATGSKIAKPVAKKLITYELNTAHMPKWCKPWIYNTETDRFVHVDTKAAVTHVGFNAINDRHAFTKKDALEGNQTSSMRAADLALRVYEIPAVNGQRYAPGQPPVFNDNGAIYANTYSERGIPEMPKKLSSRDRSNVDRVLAHVAHLLADQREQKIFLDYLAFVAKHPGRRVNWAILLQGVEGDGKSFWAVLMRAVMGFSNVRVINGSMLEERFTDWAESQCLVCVEEIRMIGHNRYDALNRIKPFITNDIVEIHPKGEKSREIYNTSNYLLFTNYQDALPLDDNSRRYMVLFSRWQRKADLDAFVADNPNYYLNLYRAVEQSAGAIRKMLLEHEPSEYFLPTGNAPVTAAKKAMADLSKPEFLDFMEELIADNEYPDISNSVLNFSRLCQLFEAQYGRRDLPQPKRATAMLSSAHFIPVGRFRLDKGGEKFRFYTRTLKVTANIEVMKSRLLDALEENRKGLTLVPEDGFDDDLDDL